MCYLWLCAFLRSSINALAKVVDDKVVFLEDYVATIEGDYLPFLIDESISLRKFKNSCGIDLNKVMKTVANG